MTLYAESSAVLAWLFGEAAGAAVRENLLGAELIVASDLTLVECDRVLIRAQTSGELSEARSAGLRARLNAAAAHWNLLHVDTQVVDRVRRPFPGEPIRTLDAIHLASALVARTALDDLALLSLDHRIRTAARRLGFQTLPG